MGTYLDGGNDLESLQNVGIAIYINFKKENLQYFIPTQERKEGNVGAINISPWRHSKTPFNTIQHHNTPQSQSTTYTHSIRRFEDLEAIPRARRPHYSTLL